MKAYSVLLAYPEPDSNGDPETYYTHVEAENPVEAVGKARDHAWRANNRFISRDRFYPLLVLAGHIEAEMYGREGS